MSSQVEKSSRNRPPWIGSTFRMVLIIASAIGRNHTGGFPATWDDVVTNLLTIVHFHDECRRGYRRQYFSYRCDGQCSLTVWSHPPPLPEQDGGCRCNTAPKSAQVRWIRLSDAPKVIKTHGYCYDVRFQLPAAPVVLTWALSYSSISSPK